MSIDNLFSIKNKVVIVSGGAGLLALAHSRAILEGGGIPVLFDISYKSLQERKKVLEKEFPNREILIYEVDITCKETVNSVVDEVYEKYGEIYGLINNAANNPMIEKESKNFKNTSFVDFSLSIWNDDIRVGLTGMLILTQAVFKYFEKQKSGVAINISSDYGLIAPNQDVYRVDGLPENEQIKKPVSYSVVKHGVIGFTKYLASYYGESGIRTNTLCPASIYNNQEERFVKRISKEIPLKRMSNLDEYVSTVLYMLAPTCSYMNGATVVLDGGRTIV